MAGRGLGTLTIDLAIKTGMFTAGLDKAGRELDAKTRKMQQRAEAFGKNFGRLLVAGFAVGGAALGIYIKNTIEAEKVQAQLVSRIKDTGAAAGRTLQQLNAQAQKLQGLTVFDDESIGEAQAALMTFTNVVGENFDRTIETATDLATVLKTDVPAAAKILGKALSDPIAGIGSLRKAGVALTDGQKAMIKAMQEAGDVAGAQRVILDALAGVMGTAAEAARNTLGGALEALKVAFNNALEGDTGSDGARGMKDAVENLITTLNSPETHQGIQSLITGLTNIASYAVEAAAKIGAFRIGLLDLFKTNDQKSLDSIMQRRQDLVARLERLQDGEKHAGLNRGILAASAIGLGPDIAEIQSELTGIDAIIKQREGLVASGLANATNPAAEANTGTVVVHGGEGFGKGNKSGLADAHRAAAEAAKAQADREDELREAIEKVTNASAEFETQFQDLKDAGDPLAQALTEYNRKLADLQKLEEGGEVSTTKRAEAEALLRTEYEKNTEAIKERLDTGAQQLKQMQQELDLLNLQTKAERDKAEFLLNNPTATDAQGDAAARLQGQIDETRKMIGAMDEFRGNFEDTVTDVLTGAKSIGDAFKSLADSIVAQIARIIAQQLTASLFGQTGTTGGGWLSSLFGMFLGGGSSGSSAVSSGSNFGIPGLGDHVFGFAAGGNPPVGTPYIVGEHGPELHMDRTPSTIVPAGKFGGGVTINIHGNATRETAQQIANEARRVMAFSGRSG